MSRWNGSFFMNEEYRRHSCGCYRKGVTSIDGRGSDPCHAHARRARDDQAVWYMLGALLVLALIGAFIWGGR